jgi:hypothetical protein
MEAYPDGHASHEIMTVSKIVQCIANGVVGKAPGIKEFAPFITESIERLRGFLEAISVCARAHTQTTCTRAHAHVRTDTASSPRRSHRVK